jgi:uncharacterized protein YcnI
MTRTRVRPAVGSAVAAGLLVLVTAVPAAAHVTANPREAKADGYAKFDFRVGHGCEGEPTEELTIQIPDGVVSVKPEHVPGWDATTEVGPLDEPVELHGEEITEGVKVVTFTAQAGSELPDDRFREFGVSMRLPDRAGETLFFPAVQTCTDGSEEAWIEIPSEGQDAHEFESPAPSVTLTAAGGGHGAAGSDDDDATAAEEHRLEEREVVEERPSGQGAATEEGDDATDDDRDATAAAAELELTAASAAGTEPLTIVALVAGLLGLVAGGAALVLARRR